MYSVALTMIVRNESRVIERCLRSALPLIDSYVICDTGSTDDTVELIKEVLIGLPGVVHERPWIDFGHNRTELAELAHGTAKFHLLLDADMTISVDGDLPTLECGVAYLARHRGEVDYLSHRMIDGTHPWTWIGATHERLGSSRPFRNELLECLSVVHHDDGADAGAARLVRDREFMEREFRENPDDPRTIFYFGLVVLKGREWVLARELLTRRVESMDGREDERYYAAVKLIQVARATGGDVVVAARRAIMIDGSRAEGWIGLARALQQSGDARQALEAARMASTCPVPATASFVEPGASTWRADTEIAHCAFKSGLASEAVAAATRVLDSPESPPRFRKLAHELGDLAWLQSGVGLKPRVSRRTRRRPSPAVLEPNAVWRIEPQCTPRWRVTNPSIAKRGDGWIVSTRLSNAGWTGSSFKIADRTGKFRSLNALIELDRHLKVVDAIGIRDPGATLEPTLSGAYGTEDLRLMVIGDRTLALGWSREFGRSDVTVPVLINLRDHSPMLLPQPDQDRHEKNWMPFELNGELHVVVRIDPLTIYRVGDDGGLDLVVANQSTGYGAAWRGGSQGCRVEGGWIFVSHERLVASGGLRYQNRFILIDSSLRLVAASDPFTISGADLEFVAGLSLDRDRLLLTAGISDRAAVLVELETGKVTASLHELGSSPQIRPEPTRSQWSSSWDNPPKRLEPVIAAERAIHQDTGRVLPERAIVHGALLRALNTAEPHSWAPPWPSPAERAQRTNTTEQGA